MSPLGLIPYMRRVENAATKLLRRCITERGLTGLPLPVPVEEWVEAPLGYRLGIMDLSPLGEGVLGAAYVAERQILVSESISNHDGRFRFTVAHELGHMTLHASRPLRFRDDEVARFETRDPVEREADRFAAAFLIPVPALEKRLETLGRHTGQKPSELVRVLRAEGEALAAERARQILVPLANAFCVSLAAMAYRFADLQLPDGSPAGSQPLLRAVAKCS